MTTPRKAKPSTRKRSTTKTSTRKSPKTRKKSGAGNRKKKVQRGKSKTSWRRWIFTEIFLLALAALLGLFTAGWVLHYQAKETVRQYLATPPSTVPGVIYSAPMETWPGQTLSLSTLVGDLLAAGYEQADSIPPNGPQSGVGQFHIVGQRIDIWTLPTKGPGYEISGGPTSVLLEDGRVASTSNGSVIQLRPTVLATIGDLNTRRTPVYLSELSPFVAPALLIMEDQRFWTHGGIDAWGILRAVAHNIMSPAGLHGGSTLTQQLAKNLFLSSERSLRRKIKEAFFAAVLESVLSKDHLLELYLSEVYLGQVGGVPIYGVEQAARTWFGVSSSRLSLSQTATIIGTIPAPNLYSPIRHPERSTERRDLVLRSMVEGKVISEAQAQAAMSKPPLLIVSGPIRRAPWAVDYAVDIAESYLGSGALSTGGYLVYTSIQPFLQRTAEEAMAMGLKELDETYPKAAGTEAALVAVQADDGGIVAMVGGRSYAQSPFNRANNAWRQAGSTVKPLIAQAAFDRDTKLTPIDQITDKPIHRVYDGQPWDPGNYDGEYLGKVSIRRAIEESRNIPMIHLAEDIGRKPLQSTYLKSGLSKATPHPSAALGAFPTTPMELAGAYTSFINHGEVSRPWLVRGIADTSREVLHLFPPERIKIASSRAAEMTHSLLLGVMDHGTGARGKAYGLDGTVGGKTGTTDDYRDAWFVGFSNTITAAVWVGRDRGTLGLSGSRAALPAWARFMSATGTTDTAYTYGEGMVFESVCVDTEQLATKSCPNSYQEIFREETVPSKPCKLHSPRTFMGLPNPRKWLKSPPFRKTKPTQPKGHPTKKKTPRR